MNTLIQKAVLFAAAALAAAYAIPALADGPDFEAMKRSLESQIDLFRQINDHETRLRALETQSPAAAHAVPAVAAMAPTSHEAIQFALSLYRGVRPEHTFVDIGCGDGRVLIAAVQKWGCNGLGIELDVNQAELARRCVEAAGLSSKIKIVEGDATKLDFKADAGFAYLYPETLEALASKIANIPAFVSYQHPVAGLKETTTAQGKFYSRDPVIAQATQDVPAQRYAVWNGRTYFQEYRPGCNCAMCQSIRYQLTIPRTTTVAVQAPQQTVAAAQPQRSGHFQRQCINGVCQNVWVWDN